MDRNFKGYTQIYFLSSTEDKQNCHMNIGVSVKNLYQLYLENLVKQVNWNLLDMLPYFINARLKF